jgi:vacuolar-type H+-ATPase subunit C/Vma6
MAAEWGELVTRARGLSTHLLSEEHLRDIARRTSLGELALALDDATTSATDRTSRSGAGDATASDVERATRRRARQWTKILARWAGPRMSRLSPLLEDEDRRSVRAVVRGATAGVPPEERLSGLIATPSLPDELLTRLARAATVREVAAMLVDAGNPYGAAVLAEAKRERPDLFTIEHALDVCFAKRATAASAKCDASMREYVSLSIDIENCWTALAGAANALSSKAQPGSRDVASGAQLQVPRFARDDNARDISLLIPGGVRLTADVFRGALDAGSRREAAALLAGAFDRLPLGDALMRDEGAETLEDAALASQIHLARGAARVAPLGSAPLILALLRLRAERRATARIAWGAALGISGARLAAEVRLA